jgi:ribosome maturation factor RimP
MTSYGDSRRAAAAQQDLSRLIGGEALVGLVLLDDDGREQPVVEGQVIRVGTDTLVFRHDELDEEISLSTISKRVQGDVVVRY